MSSADYWRMSPGDVEVENHRDAHRHDIDDEGDTLSRMSPAVSPMRPPPILTRVELGPEVLAHLDGEPVIVPAAQMLPPALPIEERIRAELVRRFPGSSAELKTDEYGSGRWCADVMVRVGFDRVMYVESTRPTRDEALRCLAIGLGIIGA